MRRSFVFCLSLSCQPFSLQAFAIFSKRLLRLFMIGDRLLGSRLLRAFRSAAERPGSALFFSSALISLLLQLELDGPATPSAAALNLEPVSPC